MSRIELTGLIGSHPLGALAAFGLLRVLAQYDDSARLSFVEKDDWIALLDSKFTSDNVLLEYLQTWGKTRAPSVFELFGEDDVRVAPSRFHAMLGASIRAAESGELTSVLTALGADGAKDQSKGYVKPSPFYMASGQQSFLDTMKKVHGHVRTGKVWQEAVFGPWTYATAEWGAGWDPGTERMHALRFKAPTKDKTACVAGAVWLAFEALPLFPTFSVAGRVQTVGWHEDQRLDNLIWPLPDTPCSVATLALLLAAEELVPTPQRRAQSAPPSVRKGVGAIYQSARHEFGQGYAVFRPSRRLA
jgi:hypothetical protein